MKKYLEDIQINVKIKLSILWISLMFFYIYNDILSLYRQEILEGLLAGELEGITFTQEVLFGASILMAIPIFMIFLSVALPAKWNRWANIIVGIFHAIVLVGTLLAPGDIWAYYAFYMLLEATFIVLIIWYAWKWPTKEVISKKA